MISLKKYSHASCAALDPVSTIRWAESLGISQGRTGCVVIFHSVVNAFFYVLIFLLFANAILSFFRLPPSNPVLRFISGAVRPVLEPFSRRIPPVGIIDISPLVAIWALFLINALIQYTLPAGW